MYHICRQREEAKRTSDTTARKDKDFLYQDPMLARLFAIRGISKILYDSLEEMSSCSCHCVYFQLRCDTASGGTFGAESNTKFVLPMRLSSRHPPAMIESIQFPIIIANMRKGDGSIEQEASDDWDIHLLIKSKLEAKESNRRIVPLKRLASIASDFLNQEGQEQRKKIRFADNQTITTSSSWAIVTIPEDVDTKESIPKVVSLEPSRVGIVSQSEEVSGDISTKLAPETRRASSSKSKENIEGEVLSSQSKPGLGGLGESGLVDLTGEGLQESMRMLERLSFRFKFRAGKGSGTSTPSPELEMPEKESSTDPKGKGKQATILESAESQQPRVLPEKVSDRHEVGESSKAATPASKHQKPRSKAQSPSARTSKSRVSRWKSFFPVSNPSTQDPVEMKLLTRNPPEAATEGPSATTLMMKTPQVEESNMPDVKGAEIENPSTAKPIAVIPESKEANVPEAETQKSGTVKPVTVASGVEDADNVHVEQAEAQKSSIINPKTVISSAEEVNISAAKGADVASESAEPNTPEMAVQAPDLPKSTLPKPKIAKLSLQECDQKKPDRGAAMKETQASDLLTNPKKATDPETPTPTPTLKEKPVEDPKSKPTDESEPPSNTSPDSLPPTIPDIENFCSLTVLDNLVPRGKINDVVGKVKSYHIEYEHLIYLERMSTANASHLSLEDILKRNDKLFQDDCFKISLALAESLLVFGTYPISFLKTGWRSCDIFFVPQLETPGSPSTDALGQPYVILDFSKDTGPISDEGSHVSPTRSKHLFSLALVLIEIGFHSPLWEIETHFQISQQAHLTRNPLAEYMKAKSILDMGILQKRMGPEFAQVVVRCFFGDFGIDQGDLSTRELQEVYHRKVVVPLKNCLERHLARSQS